ncbi:MAG: superoxide dismutase [Chitinophagales bacterium]|nr:superoxide dismutase [Chitinophagales bacterium]MDW8427130.1 superoxide dismutase [Chitinophagales bacterium]
MPFQLPPLPYPYHALEPHIDAMTMEIHHGKHHGTYVANLNKALEGHEAAEWPIEKIMEQVSRFPVAVRNNGGGHYNHSLFWTLLKPGGSAPTGAVLEAIQREFGSFDAFRDAFTQAGLNRFGSGWAWLIVNAEKKLQITSTPNQDNPLMDVAEVRGIPVLGMDVWEHAYYLKYQNRRADYINAFYNVINWDEVSRLYQQAVK